MPDRRGEAIGEIYIDDGSSYAFQRGACALRTLSFDLRTGAADRRRRRRGVARIGCAAVRLCAAMCCSVCLAALRVLPQRRTRRFLKAAPPYPKAFACARPLCRSAA